MILPADLEPSPDPAGFTLLEMLVVLAVLGLVAGLVLIRGPARSPVLELRAAANDIGQALRLARSQAITQNRKAVFVLDPARHSFHVDRQASHALPPAIELSMLAVAPEGAPQSPGISFLPDGSSSGGRIGLTLGSRHLEVGVDWLTGRVRLAEAP